MSCEETTACANGEIDPVIIETHKIGMKVADFQPSQFLDDKVQAYLNQEFISQIQDSPDAPPTFVNWVNLKEEQNFISDENNFYYEMSEKEKADKLPPSAFELTSLPKLGDLY